MTQVVYDGPQPERTVDLKDGRRAKATKGSKLTDSDGNALELDAKEIESLGGHFKAVGAGAPSKAAQDLAAKESIDLSKVDGTGKGGNVTVKDVRNAVAAARKVAEQPTAPTEEAASESSEPEDDNNQAGEPAEEE